MRSSREVLRGNYSVLLKYFGPQRWWPGETRWEVMAGAILTQNTAWSNVRAAISELRRRRLLTAEAAERASARTLQRSIRSAGYFRQKARYLKNLAAFVRRRHGGSLSRLFSQSLDKARAELLSVTGIGPETADSMLLYAGRKMIFVVDAYTLRILRRWGVRAGNRYDAVQKFFHAQVPRDAALYNEYHALFVALGKQFCKTRPLCEGCPIRARGMCDRKRI